MAKNARQSTRARNRVIVAEELSRRGGACIWSGCSETNVQWHHKDPLTKTQSVGRMIGSASAQRLRVELEKCIPYCDEHHRLRETVRRLEDGTHHGKAYCYEVLRCRRSECVEAARSKWREAGRKRRLRKLAARKKCRPWRLRPAFLRRVTPSARLAIVPALHHRARRRRRKPRGTTKRREH
jgi:hypothetical protein